MARCNCETGTCSCVVKAANDSVTVSGAGTPSSPYEISATGDLSNAFQVLDTQSVDLLLAGHGRPDDPFQLSAVATFAMDDLTDVNDPTPPTIGDVPMWMGDHWEFQPVTSGTPGAIVANNGLTGNGSALSPLQLLESGEWGTTPLGPVPPWPTDSTVGLPVYIDGAGNARAMGYPYSYSTNGSVPTPPAPFTPNTGWALDGGWIFLRWGALCGLSFNFKRTGAAISNSAAHGNISDYLIGKVADAYPNPVSYAGSIIGGGTVGPLIKVVSGVAAPSGQTPPWGSAYSTRNLMLTATTGGWTIPTGQIFSLKMMYLSLDGMAGYTPQMVEGTYQFPGTSPGVFDSGL